MGNDQVDLLLACSDVVADIGPHGQFLSEATSPEADPNNYSLDGWRYVAHPKVDQAERAIILKRNELQSASEDVDIADIRYVVEKVFNRSSS